ncbi:G8 domain-containing protein, partial [Oscillatoria sp. CS-180]|uniref:G8 domain-containing protein n=1 Tax=Oscillatoria sp. CS-180 TaxID=3021720 RepID=UPI00232ED40A
MDMQTNSMNMNGMNHNMDMQTVLWSNASEWLGQTPKAGEDVIIPPDLNVVLDTDTPELGNLVVQGKLTFGETDIALTADNIVVFGEMRAGSKENPHTHEVEIVLTGKSGDPDIVLADWMPEHSHHRSEHDGHGHLTNPVDNKALIVAPGGKLELHGTEVDSWTQLGETADVGDTSITLMEVPQGWNVGDEIAIAPTDFDAFEAEERTITDIKGSTIYFDEPLKHQHYGAQQVLDNGKTLDMRGEVTNLSRNISITGSEEGETQIIKNSENPDYYTRAGYGGHTVYMTDSEIKIDGVEFDSLGLSGELGGYPIHFHHTGDAEGAYVKNSSIHHTFQRGVVVHQTDNLLIEGNVVYDSMSHSYYIEDGVETGNEFVDNLAMLPRSTTEEFRIDNPDNGMRKEERASGFWITNQANSFEGNHVAGVPSGQGFWFIDPDNASGTAIDKDDPKGDLPMEQFEDNTAHTLMATSGNLGYRFDWTGNALEISTSFDTHPDNAAVEDFTAWKVGNMGIQIAPNRTVDIEDPIIAEARVMIQSSSRGHSGDDVLEINNATLITETDNTVEGRDIESVFHKKFDGPIAIDSERPIEFVDATVYGEEQLKISNKSTGEQITFLGDTSFEPTPDPTPDPDPDPTPDPDPDPTPD